MKYLLVAILSSWAICLYAYLIGYFATIGVRHAKRLMSTKEAEQ